MGTEAEGSIPKSNPNPEVIQGNPKVSVYEQCREERIKENLQRMQNLGILNLSRKLQSETRPVKRRYGISNPDQKSTPPLQPSRRSSRLENTAPVIYNEGINVKGKKRSNQGSVVIREGPRAEIYTEEHEKLLGNTERSWNFFVDGYDKNGKRVYDPIKGKTCHQCRQKTLGYRTQCSECNLVQGQFCGDCLFMRYGEHVLEALENPNWTCPACRGICNCSLCRNNKGWVPTGPIYRRIAKRGYKSVAHYLVQTKRMQTDDGTPNQASAKRSLSFREAKIADADDEDLLKEVPKRQNIENQNDVSLKKEEDENPNENQKGYLPEEEQKLQNIEDQNGDVLKKEENENPNSARRSLSFLLPSVDDQTQDKQKHSCAYNGDDDLPKVEDMTGQNSNLETGPVCYLLPVDDDQTPLVDVQVLRYDELPKQDKEEDSCAHIGDDDLPKVQEKTGQNSNLEAVPVSYLLSVDDQTPFVDDEVLGYLELPKQDKQEDSCAHIGDDYLPKVEEMTGQNSNLEITPISYLLPEETQTLVVKAENQELCDGTETGGGNSATVRETRKKRKAAIEPNEGSIGGRLRQRRRSQNGL